MSKRIRMIDKKLKKMQTDWNEHIIKDYSQYKKKVDQLIVNFSKVLMNNKKSTEQLDNEIEETKILDESVKVLSVKINQEHENSESNDR